MNNQTSFNVLHISDLHFSEGTDAGNPHHSHSVDHLVGLEEALPYTGEADFTVVTGDLSNHGDRQSLINASAYLFDRIPIGGLRQTGLRMATDRCGVVPGNHDAWNADSSGKLIDRRQKSLVNYNSAFPKHQIPSEHGSYYRWFEKDDVCVYMAFVDSCFLGDTEKHDGNTFGTMRLDQAIAKGKLQVVQSEKLLEWCDRGLRGTLPIADNAMECIDKAKFARSLKILVMHHYLFEPPGYSSDYFMRMSHRDIVFRNIALADFDMMLCGHKHIPSWDPHSYGYHFDKRATNRYLVNTFRRLIGLHSLPLQFEGSKGKRWTRPLTMLAGIVLKRVRADKPAGEPDEIADGVLEHLKAGLEDPEGLERSVKRFLSECGFSGEEVFDGNELRDIAKRIGIGLSVPERRLLNVVARKITGVSKILKSRQFLQSMSGSAAKASAKKEAIRCFHTYSITKGTDGWNIKAFRYQWDSAARRFDMDNPFQTNHVVRRQF